MASTPHGFRYKRSTAAAAPFAPFSALGSEVADPPDATALMEQVLLRVAIECKLPIAVKVGAVRGMNPALRTGGDGVEVADLSFVSELCRHFPQVGARAPLRPHPAVFPCCLPDRLLLSSRRWSDRKPRPSRVCRGRSSVHDPHLGPRLAQTAPPAHRSQAPSM